MSIQMVISLSFTAVAVAGILLMGLSLFLRFSSTSQQMAAESSQRVLAQVNLNLDSYLRRMMRISDAVYYSIIKNVDLSEGSLAPAMNLLYEENRDDLVSIAAFDSRGNLVASVPLSSLKEDSRTKGSPWFQAAMGNMEPPFLDAACAESV